MILILKFFDRVPTGSYHESKPAPLRPCSLFDSVGFYPYTKSVRIAGTGILAFGSVYTQKLKHEN
jgi:hypothetical protein